MEKNKVNILSTRPLSGSVIQEVLDNGIMIDVQSFIEVEPILNETTINKIKETGKQEHTVVITSMNTVEFLAKHIHPPLNWKIYCIGNTTKQLVNQLLGEGLLAGTAEDADHLADQIIADKISSVLFFCGDIRRDDLPNKLKNNDVSVEEVIIYKTIEMDVNINVNYSGILFFSPSAVRSYFKHNKVTGETVLFSIGNTTTKEIKSFVNNKVVTAKETDKESLVKQMIQYFNEKIIEA